jgi:hypothetical protein
MEGIKRTLSQDQLDEIETNGLRCPVCRSLDLRWESKLAAVRIGFNEAVWKCNRCHALILLGGQFADDGKIEELVSGFYREDLQTKEQKEVYEAWNTIHRITNCQGSKLKTICE